MPPDDALPRTTADIAVWLGGEDPIRIDETRIWHGDAAVVVALQRIREVPVARRGRAFFDEIGAIEERRKSVGDWPGVKFKWWARGSETTQ